VGAGENIDSREKGRFVEVAIRLMADDDLRYTMGRKAREYAEEAFRGQSVADRFESVVRAAKGSALGGRKPGPDRLEALEALRSITGTM
jgi:hypothetical protein